MKVVLAALCAALALSVSAPVAADKCSECELVVGFIEGWLGKNYTVAAIEKDLEKACGIIPGIASVCTALVDYGIPTIVGWLEQKEPPKVVCGKIHLCNATLTSSGGQFGLNKQFAAYKSQFNKKYASERAERKAKENFAASVSRIAALNAAAKAEGRDTKFAINKFSDMAAQDFLNKLGHSGMKKKLPPTGTYKRNPSMAQDLKAVGAPSSWDWRTKGCVSPIKNQEQCGSCWAFSATEGCESAWQLAKGGQVPILAPQQVVDCDQNDDGCDGGDLPTAFQYIQNNGMEPAKDYPYTGQDGYCQYNQQDVIVQISGFEYATQSMNETAMLVNSYAHGPLSICVDAASWQDYSGGVIQPGCGQSLDHCVQIVGWDSTNGGTPYWIVRNSWGTDWGLNGYLWVERNHDVCGIAQEATYVTI